MASRSRTFLFLLATVSACAGLAMASHAGSGDAPEEPSPRAPKVACSLSNPAYSGRCVVTVDLAQGSTPAASCRPVLDCLNDSRCLKTYCNATTVRGGWKLESATRVATPKGATERAAAPGSGSPR